MQHVSKRNECQTEYYSTGWIWTLFQSFTLLFTAVSNWQLYLHELHIVAGQDANYTTTFPFLASKESWWPLLSLLELGFSVNHGKPSTSFNGKCFMQWRSAQILVRWGYFARNTRANVLWRKQEQMHTLGTTFYRVELHSFAYSKSLSLPVQNWDRQPTSVFLLNASDNLWENQTRWPQLRKKQRCAIQCLHLNGHL